MTKKARTVEFEGSHYWAAWLQEWRNWLIGAGIGLILGVLLHVIAPPDFRAQATVVVDQNVEQAWTYFPDRQLFHFMNRETERLVELAWSDEVLEQVIARVPTYSANQLRESILDLSQPSDGGWHFMAVHNDAQTAAELANAWTVAFIDAIDHSVETDSEMQSARNALELLVLEGVEANDPQLLGLLEQIAALAERVDGISVFVEVSLAQEAQIPAARAVSQASYALAGALLGLFLTLGSTLFGVTLAKQK
jgi:hypothetical protein